MLRSITSLLIANVSNAQPETARHYGLMKSGPQAFSITDLAHNKIEPRDGVRNYRTRNFLRDAMAIGDGGGSVYAA